MYIGASSALPLIQLRTRTGAQRKKILGVEGVSRAPQRAFKGSHGLLKGVSMEIQRVSRVFLGVSGGNRRSQERFRGSQGRLGLQEISRGHQRISGRFRGVSMGLREILADLLGTLEGLR